MKESLHLMLAVICLCMAVDVGAVDVGEFEIEPTGRLHLDYAFHDADVEPLDDDGLVRRARIGLDGKFRDDWSFELVYDLADDGAFKDVSLRYDGWKPGNLTIGQFKVPFGLEELTSSNNIMFIERALPVATFAPSRRLGIGFDRNGDRYTFAAMGFGRSIDGDEGNGVGARFTFTPVDAEGTVLHLGVSATTESPKGDVDFDADPESRPTDFAFVNTGDMFNVSRIDQLGFEAALRAGPFSAQAEWMQSRIGRDFGSPDVDLDGWYVAGTWVLTGESREYDNGRFKGIAASQKRGAWELTMRYSSINLDDGDVQGGKEDNLTLGLNWYAQEYFRIMANFIQVRSEREGISDDPLILLIRAQFAF